MFRVPSKLPVIYGPCPCGDEWPGFPIVYCDVLKTRMIYDTWRRCREGDPKTRGELAAKRDRILAKHRLREPLPADRAVRRWVQAGSPRRSQEDIERIHGSICGRCYLRTPQGSCGYQWCLLETPRAFLIHRIAMATEHCPEGKW